MVCLSLLDQSQTLSPKCVLMATAVHCVEPLVSFLSHASIDQSSFIMKVSLQRFICAYLKNSAILFSIYINNSKIVLLALGFHTCAWIYIYSVCDVYTWRHVCCKMFKVNVGTQQITDVCFFF